jgi:hypothetical protein
VETNTTITANSSVETAPSTIELQGIMLAILSRFVNMPLDVVHNEITAALGQIGEFIRADRVYTFAYDFKRHITSNTHEWCAPGIQPEIHNLQNLPV